LSKGIEAKRLGRLHAHHSAPVDGVLELVTRACESVAHGEHRRRAFEKFQLGDEPINYRRRTKGTRGVVDEHGVTFDRCETLLHRMRPFGTAVYESANVNAVKRRGGAFALSFADHDAGRADRRVSGQGLHGPPQDRLSSDEAVLLRDFAAQALAFAGCDD
jgi:hypothetical protein